MISGARDAAQNGAQTTNERLYKHGEARSVSDAGPRELGDPVLGGVLRRPRAGEPELGRKESHLRRRGAAAASAADKNLSI